MSVEAFAVYEWIPTHDGKHRRLVAIELTEAEALEACEAYAPADHERVLILNSKAVRNMISAVDSFRQSVMVEGTRQ